MNRGGRAMVGALRRVEDALLAAIGLLLLAPVLLALALLIRLRLGGPVLFVQPRVGRGGRIFRLVKFRTLTTATAADGKPLPDEQRLTSLGRRLRAMSLDELPELWNVLLGDMSLVGPRPLLVDYLPHYSPAQARRHEVRPGITGWAQVRGRNAVAWDDRLALDAWYVDHRGFWIDHRILLLTVWTVLRRDGIAGKGHVTMERFDIWLRRRNSNPPQEP